MVKQLMHQSHPLALPDLYLYQSQRHVASIGIKVRGILCVVSPIIVSFSNCHRLFLDRDVHGSLSGMK